ncbi:uncharacterized protein TNCV_1058961 [Trichonephila clavipes]|nr:uncharacterized protein TNCV_1058961 [Trichonephila clavipes]
MAACVREYTLEFFTLLNAKGKKEFIEWCMKKGLIASSYECPKCNDRHDVTWSAIQRFLRNRTSHAEALLKSVVTLCPPLGKDQHFSCSESALIRGLGIAFLSLIGTQTVPGSPQFGFCRTSWSPYRFSSIAEGTSHGLPQKSNISLEELHNGSL